MLLSEGMKNPPVVGLGWAFVALLRPLRDVNLMSDVSARDFRRMQYFKQVGACRDNLVMIPDERA